MKQILKYLEKFEPNKEKSPMLHTLYDGFHTFLYTPNHVTKGGVHIRDGMDLKRTMIHVVMALSACYLFGTYNIGHQHFKALGLHEGFLTAFHLKLSYGLIKLIPIFIVTHVVGLGIEFFVAGKKGHSIEEGFLVSGALIPLLMPPDIPLWMLALAVAFAVIIGKEAFGGTGMNILNVALLARVFIFFAYPTTISGDFVWVSGLGDVIDSEGATFYGAKNYSFFHGWLDKLWGGMGLQTFGEGAIPVVQGFSGATPLADAVTGGWSQVSAHYTNGQMFWGDIPGSIGETCKPAILAGAAFLLATGIASWRIMLSMLIGAVVTAVMFNLMGFTPFMEVGWQYQFLMGSFFFAMAFMATDPVTASSTATGKWIYGFFIGSIGMIIRVLNPAYPEGWMLAILFMNVFAPLIDHYILEANITKRLKRAQ